jgi:hypothetical protein
MARATSSDSQKSAGASGQFRTSGRRVSARDVVVIVCYLGELTSQLLLEKTGLLL